MDKYEVSSQQLRELFQQAITHLTNAEKETGRIKTNSLIKAHRCLIKIRDEAQRRESIWYDQKYRAGRGRAIVIRALGIKTTQLPSKA